MARSRPYAGETAKDLIARGYHQVSRAYGTVARVDMSDDEMRAFFIAKNFGDATSSVPSCPIEQQRDQYRRCHSRDVIDGVPRGVMAAIRQAKP